jgi:hypothetical protein
LPVDAATVLIGLLFHRDQRIPVLPAASHRYATAGGFAVAAIDAPGRGDRSRIEQDSRSRQVALSHATHPALPARSTITGDGNLGHNPHGGRPEGRVVRHYGAEGKL